MLLTLVAWAVIVRVRELSLLGAQADSFTSCAVGALGVVTCGVEDLFPHTRPLAFSFSGAITSPES